MRRPSLSLLVVVVPLGVASCQGVQERLDVLRARRVEIVDENEKVTVDVGRDVRRLEERVAKLEAEVRAAKAEAEVAKVPATPVVIDAGSVAVPPDAGRPRATPKRHATDSTPDLF